MHSSDFQLPTWQGQNIVQHIRVQIQTKRTKAGSLESMVMFRQHTIHWEEGFSLQQANFDELQSQ